METATQLIQRIQEQMKQNIGNLDQRNTKCTIDIRQIQKELRETNQRIMTLDDDDYLESLKMLKEELTENDEFKSIENFKVDMDSMRAQIQKIQEQIPQLENQQLKNENELLIYQNLFKLNVYRTDKENEYLVLFQKNGKKIPMVFSQPQRNEFWEKVI